VVLYGIFSQHGQFAGPKFGAETFRFRERVPLTGHENPVLVRSTDNKVIRRKNSRNVYSVLKKLLFTFQKA
jgi:hypothetical protein